MSMGVQQSTIRDTAGATLGQMTRIAGVDVVTGNSLYFTATEDLGGGMKASGQIQLRFAALNGGSANGGTAVAAENNQNSALNTGDLFAEISGGFGAIKAGKFTFASHSGYNAFASRTVTTLAPSVNAMGGDNIVQYTSPTFSGFTVALGAAAPGTKIGQDYGLGIKLNYAAGPLSVQAAHTSSVNGAEFAAAGTTGGFTAATGNTTTATPIIAKASAAGVSKVAALGASYDLGMAMLFAATFRRSTDAPISTNLEAAGYTLSIAVPVGAATLKAGLMNNSKENAYVDRTSYGVDYALSKRTTLVAEFARDKQALTGANATNNYFVGVAHTF